VQVNASARKPWPNVVASKELACTCDSVWPGLYSQCYSPLDTPVFTVVPSNITADEGDSVTLSCRASATDKPQITWMLKDSSGVVTNIVLTASIQVDPTGDLTYTSVKSDNRGQHICKACNVAGCKRVDAFLDVSCKLLGFLFLLRNLGTEKLNVCTRRAHYRTVKGKKEGSLTVSEKNN